MRHRVAGRKLGRTSEHRLALLRNLSTALFDKERIRTTLSKAKELRPFAEKLVTLSKKETLHARRQVLRHIHDRTVVGKLFDTLSARYAQRPGGYTRIIKLGPRRGDNAEMALIELVDAENVSTAVAEEAAPKPARRKGLLRRKVQPEAEETPEPKKAKGTKTAKKKSAGKKKTAKAAAKPAQPAKKTAKKATTKSSTAKKSAAKSKRGDKG